MAQFQRIQLGKSTPVFVSLALALSLASPIIAADHANPYRLKRDAATLQIAQSTEAAPPLKGTVKESNLKAEAQLREMEATTSYLKRASTDMINEVEEANFYFTESPGDYALIATPTAAELLPPKKKWVDYVMKELADLIPILHNDITSVVIPDEKLPVVGKTMTQIQTTMDAVDASYKNLQDVTKGPKYDNLTIGRAALSIHDNVTKIEELERQAVHQLRELPDQGS